MSARAVCYVRNTRLQPSCERKGRPFNVGLVNASNRPFAALQDRPCERVGSAGKRGLWLKAGVAPGAAVAVLQREFFRTDLNLPRPM
jgi:hypothetical protein